MWWRSLAMVLTFAAGGLTGCVQVNLGKVTYDGAVSSSSEKTGGIELGSGAVDGIGRMSLLFIEPNILLPGRMPSYKPALFDTPDQLIFAESLRDELNRHRILHVVQVSEEAIDVVDVTIRITFVRTLHRADLQDYQLHVLMQLTAGERTFARCYDILSSEGDGLWDRLNTSAARGKEKAARKLMARLVPDIEAFVGSLK